MIKNRLHPTIIASGKDGFLMPDMLVKLYELDRYKDNREQLRAQGISIQPAMAANLGRIRRWILEHFSEGWADEAAQATLASPCRCLLAVRDGEEGGREILGFACYDTTAKGFFGPTGVSEAARGLGVGRALLLGTLRNMEAAGYAYAVIGWVGPAKFYETCCGAALIENSDPGYYRNTL